MDEYPDRTTEDFLRDLGANDEIIGVVVERVNDADVQSRVSKFRRFAQDNPALILGALSAVVLGGSAVAARKVMKKKSTSTRRKSTASKRELIEPHPGDKRYVRRDARGRIKESDEVGRSLSADRRRKSKTRAKRGQGDKGDR